MKKILVVLLILAVAGGLFAQDFAFSGTLKAGLQLQDDLFVADHSDPNNRATLNGALTGDDYGFNFGLHFDPKFAPFSTTTDLYNAHAWVQLLNDMLTFRVGKIDGNAWGSGGPIDVGYDSGLGFRFEAAVIEGLTLGVAIVANNDDYPESNELSDVFKDIVIGAKYDTADFAVTAAVDVDGYKADDSLSALFGINLKMIDGLTAIIDGDISTLEDGVTGPAYAADPSFTIDLGQKFEYAIASNFRAGLVLKEFLGDYVTTGIYAEPYIAYDLAETLTFALNAPLTIMDKEDARDFYGSIKPKFTYKVAGNATIDIYDEIRFGDHPDADTGWTNRFGVDFTYNF
jgi:hypothetical protein